MITQTGIEAELIYRQQAIDAFNTSLNELVVGGEENAKTVENYLNRVIETIKCLPPAQPETCEGCKHMGKWENEVEYGYPSPCTRCKRRVEDHYER